MDIQQKGLQNLERVFLINDKHESRKDLEDCDYLCLLRSKPILLQ